MLERIDAKPGHPGQFMGEIQVLLAGEGLALRLAHQLMDQRQHLGRIQYWPLQRADIAIDAQQRRQPSGQMQVGSAARDAR